MKKAKAKSKTKAKAKAKSAAVKKKVKRAKKGGKPKMGSHSPADGSRLPQ